LGQFRATRRSTTICASLSLQQQVVLMRRTLLAGLAAAALAVGALGSAQAQTSAGARPQVAEAVAKQLVERKIEIVKTTLGLTPEQQKLWPAVEEAVRSRAAMRINRITKLVALRDSDKEVSPIEIMRIRADTLANKATELKKLADAWQPLYATLDSNQKDRVAFLAAFALRELRNAASDRLMAADEQDDEEE
jgi:hypothetical protein